MPELPEVESTVRTIRRPLLGGQIRDFRSFWARSLSIPAANMRRMLMGRSVVEVSRRAKFVHIRLDDGAHLLIHLRMSGRLEWLPMSQARTTGGHVRAWWDFEGGGRLLFHDARKFGRIFYTRNFGSFSAKLGIEPLSEAFTPTALAGLLRRRSRQIKPLLLDQAVIAGLGNIYTDEALFAARIHPLARSDALTRRQIRALHEAIQTVLRRGIERNGASIDWVYPGGSMQETFAVYGRDGAQCVRCKGQVQRIVVGQRGTHVCARCQRQV